MDRNGNVVYHVFGAASPPRIYGPTYERLLDAALPGAVDGGTSGSTALASQNTGIANVGDSVTYLIDAGGGSVITPEMEKKILFGQRKNPAKNELIGGHSPDINNANPNYVVEVLQVNSDGTQKVKFVTQYEDGNLCNIKTSTLFPEGWSNDKIINSIKVVGDSAPIGVRASDGAMLYRGIVDGVQIEVIKIGDKVISGYPTGGLKTELLPGFSSLE